MKPPFRLPGALVGALFSLGVKAGGSLLALAMFAIAARGLDPEAFGRLAVTFNVTAFLAVAGVLGQDTLIIRTYAQARAAGDDGATRGALRFGWRMAAVGGAVAALGFLAVALFFADALPLAEGAAALVAATAFLASQVLLLYVSHVARTVCGVAVSEPHGEVTWRLVTIAGFVLLGGLLPGIGTAVFFASAATGSLAATAIQAIAIRRTLPPGVRTAEPRADTADWLPRSARIATSTTAEGAAQYGDVVLIGLFASPMASAAYFVAARYANVFLMIAGGLHGYTSSRFATLFLAGRTGEAQDLLKAVILVALAVTAGLFLLLAVAGGPLLGLFGAVYRDEVATLLVLSAGTALAGLMGPSPLVLMTTGHERLYGRVILASFGVRAAAIALAAPAFGALGAAIAVTVVLVPTSLGLALYCRRVIGIDPSLLGAIRRPGLVPGSIDPPGGP